MGAPQISQGSTTTIAGGTGSLGGSSYTGAFGSATDDLPGLGSLLSSLYGSKPATADPTATASTATLGNLSDLGNINDLTIGTDQITGAGEQLLTQDASATAADPYELNLPGYEQQIGEEAGNVNSELQGQVPADVKNQLQQQAAERGVATGQSPVSPNSTAAYLQSLGLTSLDLQQQGQAGLSGEIAQTPTGTLGAAYNPSQMFVTPEQEQAAQQAANTEAAAPDPEAAGLLNTAESC